MKFIILTLTHQSIHYGWWRETTPIRLFPLTRHKSIWSVSDILTSNRVQTIKQPHFSKSAVGQNLWNSCMLWEQQVKAWRCTSRPSDDGNWPVFSLIWWLVSHRPVTAQVCTCDPYGSKHQRHTHMSTYFQCEEQNKHHLSVVMVPSC